MAEFLFIVFTFGMTFHGIQTEPSKAHLKPLVQKSEFQLCRESKYACESESMGE